MLTLTNFLHKGVGEAHETMLYLTCLLSVPICYAVCFNKKVSIFVESLSKKQFTLIALSSISVVATARIIMLHPYVLMLAALSFGLSLLSIKKVSPQIRGSLILFFLCFALSCISWDLANKLNWWCSSNYFKILFHKNFILILPLLLVITLICFKSLADSPRQRAPSEKILYFTSVLFIFYLCGRPYLIDGAFLHHQSFYVGPIELVKQGGSLLWDVPSQYGLLNIYLSSKINLGTTWQTFLVINKLFVLSEALILFIIISYIFRGVTGLLFSLLLTCAAIFCWSGYIENMAGPFPYPSVGAFRFIWCFVAIALNFIFVQLDNTDKRALTACGTAIWTLSVFWSIESAIYVSAIWLSFYFTRQLCAHKKITTINLLHSSIKTLRLFVLPFIVFITISVIYYFRLGHYPDWFCYIEYALAYSNGFGSMPINPHGGVSLLIAIFLAGTIITCLCIRERSKHAPFMASALAGFWVVASYFVSRSHENNIANLMPFIVFLSSATLYSTHQITKNSNYKTLLNLFFIPIFFVIIEIPLAHKNLAFIFPTFSNLDYLGKNILTRNVLDQNTAIVNEIPKIKDDLKIPITAPFIFIGSTLPYLPNTIIRHTFWLPVAPYAQLIILSKKRQITYLNRFIRRAHSRGGWLMHSKALPSSNPIQKILDTKFKLLETKFYNNWTFEFFEYQKGNLAL